MIKLVIAHVVLMRVAASNRHTEEKIRCQKENIDPIMDAAASFWQGKLAALTELEEVLK